VADEKHAYLCRMRKLIVNIPDTLDLDEKDLLMVLAAGLYEHGKLSIGQAAELVGLSKRTFMELLGKYNVSVFNYPASDLSKDVRNA